MKRIFYIVLFLMISAGALQAQNDSTAVLGFEEFMEIVKENHPMAKQAALQSDKGQAAVLKARGGFDPKLYTDYAQKNFNKKQYYSLLNAGLKIPTWFGVELKGGYEQNQTLYNDVVETPEGGLWFAGLTIPVGQGLFIDERRAELRKAQLYEKSSQAEGQLILNELFYEAGKAYWDWFKAYNTLKVYKEALSLAQQRYEAVKAGTEVGDRPEIDKTEASIQLQNRQLSLEQAQLDYDNATALLSVYLWANGLVPMEIADNTVPVMKDQVKGLEVKAELYTQLDSLTQAHPVMQQYNYKLDQLTIDRRLKQDKLKPKLDVNINLLTENTGEQSEGMGIYNPQDYKVGVTFSMPIFLRKERGDLKMSKLKIKETQMEMTNKNVQVSYKAVTALNEWKATKKQVDVCSQTVKDYRLLLSGEQEMFEAGESSLFMVNSREVKYISAQVKLVELLAKNHKAMLASHYAFGRLGN